MVNIPRLRAVSRHSALHRAQEQPLAMIYWPYTTPPRALLLKYNINTLPFVTNYISGFWGDAQYSGSYSAKYSGKSG